MQISSLSFSPKELNINVLYKRLIVHFSFIRSLFSASRMPAGRWKLIKAVDAEEIMLVYGAYK